MKADKDGNWTYKFENLPKYKDSGVEIIYTVTEDANEDYTAIYETSKDNYDITNKYTPGKTSVTVEKAWSDGDDQDGIRPASVTVKLLADGVDTGKTIELNADNRWEGDFTELDEKKDGKDISYTVEEVKTDVITGTDTASSYAIAVDGDAVKGYIITNIHTPVETPDIPDVPKVPVIISKTDMTTGNELEGARLVVVDSETEEPVVDEWTSGKEAVTIELAPGTYVLTEIDAPEGYIIAEPIEFTVDENGLVGIDKVEMKNKSELVYDLISMNVTLEKVWKNSKGEVIEWPGQVEVEFVVQTMDGNGDWIDYKDENGETLSAILTADKPDAEFEGLPAYVDGNLAEYRAVELTTLKDYKFVECETTDLNSRKGEMVAVNAYTGEEEPSKGGDDEKEETPEGSSTPDKTSVTPAPATRYEAVPSVSTGVTTGATSTGDANDTVLWIVLGICAAAAIAGASIGIRRRKRHED